MFTKEQINELLSPWDMSVDERPKPNGDYAYEKSDRRTAYAMAKEWGGVSIPLDPDGVMEDFICHQSDVIEMLARALSFANKKIEDKQDMIEILEDQVSMLQESC